jgi:putative ABC transport system permease protein
MALSSGYKQINTYVNNKKISIEFKYTNDQYWDVLQYKFLEGKAYNKQQVDRGERVAVISEAARDKYFGKVQAVTGKYIEADNMQYRVIGVVQNVPLTLPHVYSEIYLPYTVAKTDLSSKGHLIGNFSAILLVNSRSDLGKLKEEYAQMAARVPLPGKEYDKLYTFADTYFIGSMRRTFGEGENSGLGTFYTIISIMVFLFLLLPTINLMNVNISRIMERYSEIGVRKAFGASSRTLAHQFIVENIILTFFGGAIGIVLALLVIHTFNSSELIPNAYLRVNGPVLLLTMLACFVFGLISGVYPAWRMSRMQVVHALKAS